MRKILVYLPFLILMVSFVACDTNYNDIDELVETKNTSELIKIIDEYYYEKDTSKSALVNYAIKKILHNDLREAFPFLETRYLNNPFSEHGSIIVSSFFNNKQVFKDSVRLVTVYVEKIIDSKNIYKNNSNFSTQKKSLEEIISQYGKVFINKIMLKNISTAINLYQYEKSYELFNSYKSFNLKLDEDQLYIKTILKKLAKIEKGKIKSFSNFSKIQNIDKIIKEIEETYNKKTSNISKEIQNIKQDNSNFYETISSLERKISSLKENISDLDYFWLSGYIVAESAEDYRGAVYEIQVPYNNYRSLLVRMGNARYTSKGSFSLRVRQTGTRRVTVKDDFGGFKQEWKVYEEVPQSEFDKLDEKKMDLIVAKSKLQNLEAETKDSNRQIKKLERKQNKFEKIKRQKIKKQNSKRDKEVAKIQKERKKLLFELKKMESIIF